MKRTLLRPSPRIDAALGGDSSVSELYATLPALIWAAVLAAPGSTFDTSPAYQAMRVMPEAAWSLLLGLYGALGVVAWLRQWNAARRRLMFSGVALWLLIVSLLGSAAPLNTAWVYVTPALAALVAYLQLGERLRRGMA